MEISKETTEKNCSTCIYNNTQSCYKIRKKRRSIIKFCKFYISTKIMGENK